MRVADTDRERLADGLRDLESVEAHLSSRRRRRLAHERRHGRHRQLPL
jgi:hypothetical protein